VISNWWDFWEEIYLNQLIEEWLKQSELKQILKESQILVNEYKDTLNKKLQNIEISKKDSSILEHILDDGWEINNSLLDKSVNNFLKDNIVIRWEKWELYKAPSKKWKELIIEKYLEENKYSKIENWKLLTLIKAKVNLYIESINLQNKIKHSDKIYKAYKSWNLKDLDKILENEFQKSIQNNNIDNNLNNNKKAKLETPNNNYYITNENNYLKTDGWYILKWKDWKTIEWLVISEEEKKITLWNPEATENLIHFYEFFKELNLLSVWKYRKELMISMWNRNINFVDNDSLSKSELVQFWNNLILSINNLIDNNKELNKKPKLLITNSLSWVQNELRKFSWASSILSDEKTHNNKWEDKFAATLRNFWIIWWAYFKINTFRDKMKK
jgi:hypothetical protein